MDKMKINKRTETQHFCSYFCLQTSVMVTSDLNLRPLATRFLRSTCGSDFKSQNQLYFRFYKQEEIYVLISKTDKFGGTKHFD